MVMTSWFKFENVCQNSFRASYYSRPMFSQNARSNFSFYDDMFVDFRPCLFHSQRAASLFKSSLLSFCKCCQIVQKTLQILEETLHHIYTSVCDATVGYGNQKRPEYRLRKINLHYISFSETSCTIIVVVFRKNSFYAFN